MMKFHEIIQILFLTAIISVNGVAKITQTKQVVIQPHFEGEMICLWFHQSEPPYEGDGGSRFYEPPKPDQNSDESLFQV